jgi:hypothetical protein
VRDKLLDQVHDAILGRATIHGSPEDSFSRIAQYWSLYLDYGLTGYDVAMMMALMKVARAESNPQHADNHVDAAGYLILAGEQANGD